MHDVRERVRVTIEGDVIARYGDEAVRVATDTASLMLPTRDGAVSVETLTPDYQWSAGDVVLLANSDAWRVWVRGDAYWHSYGRMYWTDDDGMARTIALCPDSELLRYQAGEGDR